MCADCAPCLPCGLRAAPAAEPLLALWAAGCARSCATAEASQQKRRSRSVDDIGLLLIRLPIPIDTDTFLYKSIANTFTNTFIQARNAEIVTRGSKAGEGQGERG